MWRTELTTRPDAAARVAELVRRLDLQPHPEGGHYREHFRAAATVQPGDTRPPRCALTSIDFVLARGEFSAWHRVASDEAWHWLEGEALRLWLLPPALDAVHAVVLHLAGEEALPRHVVPAGWWQAVEPLGAYAYVGAAVGPGFEFADFSFGRDEPALREALARRRPDLLRLL